jgi:hypothetical protein
VSRVRNETWGGKRESNPQPSEPQSGALPVELFPPPESHYSGKTEGQTLDFKPHTLDLGLCSRATGQLEPAMTSRDLNTQKKKSKSEQDQRDISRSTQAREFSRRNCRGHKIQEKSTYEEIDCREDRPAHNRNNRTLGRMNCWQISAAMPVRCLRIRSPGRANGWNRAGSWYRQSPAFSGDA